MATQTEPRLPLSRDRILQAALELVDEGGIESLTMRKLGQALGFEAMSLYNHVANKDDVLDGILDLVLAESEPPSPAGDWDAAIRTSAISVHEALRRHPWSCTLLMSPGHVRPARLRYMDLLLGRLREAGFSAETTYTRLPRPRRTHLRLLALGDESHLHGGGGLEASRRSSRRSITADAYPYLHEHAEQHFSEGPHREVSAFELGLDLILDGLEKIRDAA